MSMHPKNQSKNMCNNVYLTRSLFYHGNRETIVLYTMDAHENS